MVGVAVVGALFAVLVQAGVRRALLERTLASYSDALADHGFSRDDPELWRAIAARHSVAIRVEPVAGEPFAFDAEGAELGPDEVDHGRGTVRTLRRGPGGATVSFAWRTAPLTADLLPHLVGLVILLAGVVGAAVWLARRQLAPLSRLHRGVEAVGAGDLGVRLPVERDDEIGRIASAFNRMAARIAAMLDARERLLADVSHELRSPIARMKVALELLPPSRERSRLDRDLREMEGLVTVLLEREALRARAETPAAAAGRFADVDLGAIVREAVERAGNRSPDIRLAPPPEEARLRGDPALLGVLVGNLLDNAVKFSRPESGPIEVSIAVEEDRIVLRVADDGIGFPPGAAERLLEPFAKLDPARGHHVGYGLGLDLCRRIAALHGGGLRLGPRDPTGTVVEATLGRAAEVVPAGALPGEPDGP